MTAEIHESLAHIVGAQKLFGVHDPMGPGQNQRASLLSILPTEQDKMPVRSLTDSYDEVTIPIGSDVLLRELYLNSAKHIRLGKILEDLDIFAVWIAYKHNMDPSAGSSQMSPLSFVTANVDRIDVPPNVRFQSDKDIILRGHVVHVGKSSCDVSIEILQESSKTSQYEKLLQATFVMAARDSVSNTKVVINPLKPASPDEQKVYDLNKNLREEHHGRKSESLFVKPPTEDERKIMHDLFLKTVDPKSSSYRIGQKPRGSVWMNETRIKSMHICHPQSRNIFNKIFGGFLMREAFELAWCNVFMNTGTRPVLLAVDEITFERPVEIGSVLASTNMITYSKGKYVQSRVLSEVINPVDGSRQTTNTFNFTFVAPRGKVPEIYPKTYSEMMLYLTGKRFFEVSMKNREDMRNQ